MMRTLVVYYSLSGNTARLATALAEALSADTERVEEVSPRRGLWGGLSGVYEVMVGALPKIRPPSRDPATYDLVIVGGPVWAGGAATPLRTYLNAHKGRIARAAYFVTAGGDGVDGALAHMAKLAGASAEATLGVSGNELRSGGWREKLEAFIAAIRAIDGA